MNFADDRKMNMGTMIGIGIVILLHFFLVYALVSGLATSVVDVIKKPLEIKIIEASPPPPAPPPMTPPPPPRLVTPVLPYVPPPVIQVQQANPPPAIAVTTTVKPPPPAQAPPAPAAPPAVDVAVVCPNIGTIAGQLSDSFQDIADTDDLTSAFVVVAFSIGPHGEISGAHIVSSTSPDVNQLALRGIATLHCTGQGQTVQVRAPFRFSTN